MSNKSKLLASAQKNLQKGQIGKAIKDYQKIVELDPKDIRSRQKLAELLSRNGQVDEALEQYEVVAKYYTENGFYLKAIAVYKQMQRLDPSQVRIYHRLAELNEKQGLTGNALAEYRSLIHYYEQHDMVAEVINVLQKMKDLDPENLNVLVKIAEAYARSGMKDKAREEFLEVVERLRSKNEFSKILKLCDLLLPFFPDDPEALAVKGEALVATDSAAEAVSILSGVAERKPDTSSFDLLAQACHASRDYAGEVEARRRLVELNSNNLERRLDLVDALIAAEQDEAALEELEEWKDSCVQADLTARVKSAYEQLRSRLGDEPRIVETLKAVYEITGEGEKLFDLMSSSSQDSATGTPTAESLEILDDKLVDDALSDLEVPEDDEAEDKEIAIEVDVSGLSGGNESDLAEVSTETDSEELVSASETEAPEADDADEVPLEFLEEVVEDVPAEEESAGQPDVALEQTEEEPGISLDDLDLDGGELELELELELDEDAQPVTALESLEEAAVEEAAVEEAAVEEAAVEEAAVEEAAVEEAAVEEAAVEEPEAEIELVEEDIELVEEDEADIDALLDEAAFYLQQNLFDEAERLCQQALASAPDHSRALQLQQEITSGRQALSEDEEGFVWDDALKELLGDSIGTIDAEDAESHYNLGIAYKEMGLLDDAVKEFETAMVHPSRRISSLTLKALCLMETGDLGAAEESLRLGLACPDLASEEKLNLLFEMGQLKEAAGQLQEALDWFNKVAASDHFYRDVGLRIRQLRSQLGLPDEEIGGAPGSQGRDKVSYL